MSRISSYHWAEANTAVVSSRGCHPLIQRWHEMISYAAYLSTFAANDTKSDFRDVFTIPG